MTCSEVRPFLGAFVDNELELRQALEIEAHVRTCASCRAEEAELRALSEAARAHLSRFLPAPALEARVRAALGSPPARRRAAWAWGAAAAAAAAALLLFFLARPAARSGDELAVIDAHSRALLAQHLTDVESSDQHTVKPWFQGKLPYGVPAASFPDAGFPLIGGRLDVLAGRPVAVLVYRRRNHTIDAFVWPEAEPRAVEASRERGYALLSWGQDGLGWWLCSDAAPDDLRALQALLAAAP
jgi:anti-sigma factor RsiW